MSLDTKCSVEIIHQSDVHLLIWVRIWRPSMFVHIPVNQVVSSYFYSGENTSSLAELETVPLLTPPFCSLCLHWDTTGSPTKYLQGTLEELNWNCPTLECHWRNFDHLRLHWNTTGKLSWNCPTLECHWRNSDYCSLHWNTTGGRHTHQAHVVNQSSICARLKRHDGRTPKKISKLRVTGLCAGNSPVTGWIPAQRARNAENASIWWRHLVCWYEVDFESP